MFIGTEFQSKSQMEVEKQTDFRKKLLKGRQLQSVAWLTGWLSNTCHYDISVWEQVKCVYKKPAFTAGDSLWLYFHWRSTLKVMESLSLKNEFKSGFRVQPCLFVIV